MRNERRRQTRSERLRFEREARAVAWLNHPIICTLLRDIVRALGSVDHLVALDLEVIVNLDGAVEEVR